MSKKVFVIIVALMSISLIGIILVQLYWIDNAVKSKKAQFKNEVQKSLGSVSQKIISKEELEFEKQIENLIKDKVIADNAQIKNYLFQQMDTATKQRFTFGATILEENFKLPTDFLDNDTIIFKRVSGKKDFFQSKLIKGVDNIFTTIDENRFSFQKRLSSIERAQFSEFLRDVNSKKPIYQRISNRELKSIIKKELTKRNVDLDFKYGVYSKDGLATKLKSGYYTINKKESYQYPLFFNTNGDVDYGLP